jgi:hypothetical protein
MKIKGGQKKANDNAETRLEHGKRGDVAEVPHPPVFCKKSPQSIENKRGDRRKECKERKRVRKSLRTQDLQGGMGAAARKKWLKRCEGEGQPGGKIISER